MSRSSFHYWYLLRLFQVLFHWAGKNEENVWPRPRKTFARQIGKVVRTWIPFVFLVVIPGSLELAFLFSPWNQGDHSEPGLVEYSIVISYFVSLYALFKCSKSPKFMPRNLRALFSALDDAEEELVGNNGILSGFRDIRSAIEKALILHPKGFIAAADASSAEEVVYFAIVRQTGGMAGSGDYHLYRGLLNPLSGQNLPLIHERALERLVELGALDKTDLLDAKNELLADIAVVG